MNKKSNFQRQANRPFGSQVRLSAIDADICKGGERLRIWPGARTLGQPSDLIPKESAFSASAPGAPVFSSGLGADIAFSLLTGAWGSEGWHNEPVAGWTTTLLPPGAGVLKLPAWGSPTCRVYPAPEVQSQAGPHHSQNLPGALDMFNKPSAVQRASRNQEAVLLPTSKPELLGVSACLHMVRLIPLAQPLALLSGPSGCQTQDDQHALPNPTTRAKATHFLPSLELGTQVSAPRGKSE